MWVHEGIVALCAGGHVYTPTSKVKEGTLFATGCCSSASHLRSEDSFIFPMAKLPSTSRAWISPVRISSISMAPSFDAAVMIV